MLEGSAAAAAGLKPGDRLLVAGEGWAKRPLKSLADLRTAVILAGPGARLPLRLERDGAPLTLTLDLPEQ